MVKNNSLVSSIWENFLKVFSQFQKKYRNFSLQYPNTSQTIQLSFIYFFAVVDLLHAVFSNVVSLNYLPEFLSPCFPFIKSILQSPFFKIWGSPEKVFFLSYVVIEFIVVRPIFKFSKLIKYNVLLLFALLMLQGLVISYWDLLFHREIATPVGKWAYDQGGLIYTDKSLATIFFLNTFVIFLVGYSYLYIRSIQGKFATIPGMEWLTDSVAFWLRIKTPTMRFGKGKEKK